MDSQLLAAAASPSTATAANTTTPSAAAAANGTSITTLTSPSSTATTVFSLTEDDLREIFIRLPDLPTLVRAAFTCRPWLRAVRSSRTFRALFRSLHPAPLIGLFFEIGNASAPSFLPLHRSDPVVTAALRRGDFFLTSLPPSPKGWGLADCRDGYVLLWNGMQDRPSVAALNPMTWAVDVLPPLSADIIAGSRRVVAVLGFFLVSSEDQETPRSFRVACVCTDKRRVRAAVFSSETREWSIRPWVRVAGYGRLKFMAGALVGGSVFWPYHGDARMVRIDAATMDVSFMDLPPQVEKDGYNVGVGETRNGELCVVYASSDFFLHVWVRRRGADGGEVWAPPAVLSLREELDQLIQAPVLNVRISVKVVQVSPGLVHMSATCTSHIGTRHCWFFSLSLETMAIELLLEGDFDGVAHLYNMAWPPSLVGDDDNDGIGHE